MNRALIIIMLVTATAFCANAQSAKPAEAFIPNGYEKRIFETGDLNQDKIPDAILILTKKNEVDFSMEKPAKRPLIILFGKGNNKYVQAGRNDNAVLCYHCGGAFGDPLENVVIKNGYFSIEHYGGSRERWSRIITFKYNTRDKNFYLHKDGTSVIDNTDLERDIPDKIKTTKDFGTIRFENFNVYKYSY